MKEFCIVHEFDASPALYWKLFFLTPYNDDFYGSVGLVREVITTSSDEKSIEVRARYESGRPLPDFVTRALRGRRLGFREVLRFDVEQNRALQTIVPDLFASQVSFRGEICVEALAVDRIRRTYRGALHIAVPILGRRVEDATLREMKRTHDQAAVVTRSWLANRTNWEDHGVSDGRTEAN